MTRIAKLYAWASSNPRAPMPFRDFERLLRAFGFIELRQRGSHRSFQHPNRARLLVVQPRGGEAKPYQIKEFLDMVGECGLELDEQ